MLYHNSSIINHLSYVWQNSLLFQERIQVGKELLEAKRIEEENERKRFVFYSIFCALFSFSVCNDLIQLWLDDYCSFVHFCYHSLLALRKAEKEEEKRARVKIRQKLEEDKVLIISFHVSFLSDTLIKYPTVLTTWSHLADNRNNVYVAIFT